MTPHPIVEAIMRCASDLASQRMVSEGPPMTHVKGIPSLSSFEKLFTSFSTTQFPVLSNPKDSFLSLLRQLYNMPLMDPIFRRVYMMTNTIYDILCQEHRQPLFAYNQEKVQQFTKEMSRKSGKKITITMTTCKRMDLFERTVNSMIECITDMGQHVFDWIVVDDQTSSNLIQEMKVKYPFIHWIEKSGSEKGHPRSMNIIRQELFTPYQLHVEDDWEFFIPLPYCRLLLERINIQPDLYQVLINLNYTEDQKTANSIWGAEMKVAYPNNKSDPSFDNTSGAVQGIRYFVHRHFTGSQLHEENAKLGCPNSMYWPHFSFRVGLTDTRVYSLLGLFDEQASHFEMDYATRYVSAGLKTGFLDGIFCTHIGRRTYERDTNKQNAYDLNQEQQFGEPVKKIEERVEEPPKNPSTEVEKVGLPLKESGRADEEFFSVKKSRLIDTYVINLKRRTDRLITFFNRNEKCSIPIKVYDGIDGKTLEPTPEIQSLFSTGDYHYRKGIVGCALSHIALWKQFVADPHTHYLIVLEDDVVLTKNFSLKIMNIIKKHINHPTFDLLFMHYNPYPPYRYNKLYLQYAPVEVEVWSKTRSVTENMGSGAAYMLTKTGAKQLLEHINTFGVYNAIDWVMFKSGVQTAYTTPMLAFAECVQTGSVDTDIQNVYESVQYEDWTLHEIKRWKDQLQTNVSLSDTKWSSEYKIPQTVIKTHPTNKIICVPMIDKDLLEINDKILITGLSELKKIQKIRGPFVWYATDRCIFIVPFLYTCEEFLKQVPLCGNRMV